MDVSLLWNRGQAVQRKIVPFHVDLALPLRRLEFRVESSEMLNEVLNEILLGCVRNIFQNNLGLFGDGLRDTDVEDIVYVLFNGIDHPTVPKSLGFFLRHEMIVNDAEEFQSSTAGSSAVLERLQEFVVDTLHLTQLEAVYENPHGELSLNEIDELVCLAIQVIGSVANLNLLVKLKTFFVGLFV